MSTRPHLTHIAIQSHDVEASIRFYRDYVGLYVVHDRIDDGEGVRVVWLSETPRNATFVIVVIGVPPTVQVQPALLHHQGYDLPSRAAVDEIAARARADGVLAHGPVDAGGVVGYLCMVRDPDGHMVEFSHGQPINPKDLPEHPETPPEGGT